MNKNSNIWALLAMFLLGTVIGFTFAPIKKGVNVRVMNNGNNYSDDCCSLDEYDDYDVCEDCDCEDCDECYQDEEDAIKF